MIKNTQVILTTWDDENSMLSNTSASLNTNLKEVTDDAKIAKVEQVYEDEMALINNKDTNYDNVLSKLETERTSLNTEIESLENIIKNNIETTFKLYS
jgi:phospholipid N-methyltransferase